MAIEIVPKQADAWLVQVRMFLGPGMIESFTVCEILADRDWHAQQLAELRESAGPVIIGSSSCETRFGTWGDPPSPRTDRRRPRIFTFANGSEIDVDRYLGLDATATSRTDSGDRPAITFQLGHGGFLRVAFESEQQRVDELARLRAFRDGAA